MTMTTTNVCRNSTYSQSQAQPILCQKNIHLVQLQPLKHEWRPFSPYCKSAGRHYHLSSNTNAPGTHSSSVHNFHSRLRLTCCRTFWLKHCCLKQNKQIWKHALIFSASTQSKCLPELSSPNLAYLSSPKQAPRMQTAWLLDATPLMAACAPLQFWPDFPQTVVAAQWQYTEEMTLNYQNLYLSN